MHYLSHLLELISNDTIKNASVFYTKHHINIQPIGRKVIDVANRIRTEKIVSSKPKTTEIHNLVDVIDRYSNNPEKLFTHLETLVIELCSSTKELSSLQEENAKLKSSVIELKEETSYLQQQVRLLEESLSKLFYYSDKKGTPL